MKLENLKYLRKLGRGAHGSVYLFEDDELQPLACKSIDIRHRKHANTEIKMLKKINHKNIIRYVHDFIYQGNVMILLEYVNYGSLESLISFFRKNKFRIKNWLAWSAFVQIVEALSYLESFNIVHRDIKPANILINKRKFADNEFIEFKICDFSLAASLDKNKKLKAKSLVGTPYYMAPEIVQKLEYDYSVDTCGLGVTIYELFRLKKPFKGVPEDSKVLISEITTKKIFEIPHCTDMNICSVLLLCLEKDNRPYASDLLRLPVVSSKIEELKIYQAKKESLSIEMNKCTEIKN